MNASQQTLQTTPPNSLVFLSPKDVTIDRAVKVLRRDARFPNWFIVEKKGRELLFLQSLPVYPVQHILLP